MKKDKFPKLKRWTFETPFFPVRLVIGPYKEAVFYRDWLFEKCEWRNVSGDTGDDEPNGQTWYRAGYPVCLWLPRPPKTSVQLATLAHELVHCVAKISYYANVKLDKEEHEEFFAHHTSFLFEKMLLAMRHRPN